MGGQRHASAALPPGKSRYPFYRRLGGPQGRSGRLRKISPPPGFDPRTVQRVLSRYTNYVISARRLYEGTGGKAPGNLPPLSYAFSFFDIELIAGKTSSLLLPVHRMLYSQPTSCSLI